MQYDLNKSGINMPSRITVKDLLITGVKYLMDQMLFKTFIFRSLGTFKQKAKLILMPDPLSLPQCLKVFLTDSLCLRHKLHCSPAVHHRIE